MSRGASPARPLPARPTEEGLQAHFRAMLPAARVHSLDDLTDQLALGCVDGRRSRCVVGAPGGNAGALVLLLAAFEEESGHRLPLGTVEELFLRYLDHFGSFYVHTDRNAQDLLAATPTAGGTGGPEDAAGMDALLLNPPDGTRAELLEALLQPPHVGCGHLRLLLEEPRRYRVRRSLVQDVVRSFFLRLWEGDPRLTLEVLEGGHEERAVVMVRTRSVGHPTRSSSHTKGVPPGPPLVTACPRHGGLELYVHHPEAADRLQVLHADFLVRSGLVDRGWVPAGIRIQRRLGTLHLENTLGRLAAGLPLFDVRVEVDEGGAPADVVVRMRGRVPRGAPAETDRYRDAEAPSTIREGPPTHDTQELRAMSIFSRSESGDSSSGAPGVPEASVELSPEGFLERREPDAPVLDVRTPREFEGGHLEGARNVNLLDEDFLQEIERLRLDPDEPVYLYCRTGNRSGQAARLLRERGYARAFNIGGLEDLAREGAPTEPRGGGGPHP
jgi:rhodanese-related sulfurtransferase